MWLLCTCTLYLSIIGNVKSTVDYLQHPVKSCHVGDAVENECNKCLCTSKTVFECTPIDCKNKISRNTLEKTGPLCVPNQLYVKNLITCICTKDGKWPHKSCHDTFQSLPPNNVITHKCTPDTYIPIDCNVCRCGTNGEILNDRCTRNVCDDDVQRRTNTITNTLYSKCEEKYWYSLAPCQFCFCVSQNKLVCNTGSYYTKTLDLGSYKLNICGKELIKEAIELIPDNLRMLRENSDLTNLNTSFSKKVEPSEGSKSNDESTNEMDIELNRESKDKNNHTLNVLIGNISSSNEYYSDEVERNPQILQKKRTTLLPTTRGLRSTQIPDQDGYETVDETEVKSIENPDIDTTEDDNLESKGIEVEFDNSPTTKDSPRPHFDLNTRTYQYDGNTLKINVPKVLNKVFEMALRKSMVSLSKHSTCTPGATSVHDCNMCFCLKNSKLLCTNHKCVGGKKA